MVGGEDAPRPDVEHGAHLRSREPRRLLEVRDLMGLLARGDRGGETSRGQREEPGPRL